MTLHDNNNLEIFLNKKTDKIYVSKSIQTNMLVTSEIEGLKEVKRPIRIASKVFDCQEDHKFVKEGKELILRITKGGRQEIDIKFYEDTRGVFALQFQKFTTLTGSPHHTYFTFVGDEIAKIFKFIQNVALIHLKDSNSLKIDDRDIDDLILTKEQTLKIIRENPEIISEILRNDLTKSDIIALGYRKEQLNFFYSLLNNDDFFQKYMQENSLNRPEAVWQKFFEKNTWILGYGLNYILIRP